MFIIEVFTIARLKYHSRCPSTTELKTIVLHLQYPATQEAGIEMIPI
jgi:hypothetical protein